MKKLLTTLRLVNISSNPENGSEGELFYNSSASSLVVRSGGLWKEIPFSAKAEVSSNFPPHDPGHLHFNTSDLNFYVSYGNNWIPVGSYNEISPEDQNIINGGIASTSLFRIFINGGFAGSIFENDLNGGGASQSETYQDLSAGDAFSTLFTETLDGGNAEATILSVLSGGNA